MNHSFSKTIVIDETSLFLDNMGNYTLEVKDVKQKRMQTTGNKNKFQTRLDYVF